MTPSTRSKKTLLERAEERRLAAMTPADRERLQEARKKLRARSDVLLDGRPLGKRVSPDPIQVTRDTEELI